MRGGDKRKRDQKGILHLCVTSRRQGTDRRIKEQIVPFQIFRSVDLLATATDTHTHTHKKRKEANKKASPETHGHIFHRCLCSVSALLSSVGCTRFLFFFVC